MAAGHLDYAALKMFQPYEITPLVGEDPKLPATLMTRPIHSPVLLLLCCGRPSPELCPRRRYAASQIPFPAKAVLVGKQLASTRLHVDNAVDAASNVAAAYTAEEVAAQWSLLLRAARPPRRSQHNRHATASRRIDPPRRPTTLPPDHRVVPRTVCEHVARAAQDAISPCPNRNVAGSDVPLGAPVVITCSIGRGRCPPVRAWYSKTQTQLSYPRPESPYKIVGHKILATLDLSQHNNVGDPRRLKGHDTLPFILRPQSKNHSHTSDVEDLYGPAGYLRCPHREGPFALFNALQRLRKKYYELGPQSPSGGLDPISPVPELEHTRCHYIDDHKYY